MNRIARLLQLDRRERFVLAEAAVCLIASRIALALAGFGRTRRLLLHDRHSAHSADRARAEMLARAVHRAGEHLWFATTCLDRAVALYWLLVINRVGGALRIGVRLDSGALQAHAWVECGGEVLLDPLATDFVPFDAPLLGVSTK